jgi:hypothetical protein
VDLRQTLRENSSNVKDISVVPSTLAPLQYHPDRFIFPLNLTRPPIGGAGTLKDGAVLLFSGGGHCSLHVRALFPIFSFRFT